MKKLIQNFIYQLEKERTMCLKVIDNMSVIEKAY
jgi:hypothetical protein